MIIKNLQNIEFDSLFGAFSRAFEYYAISFDKNEVRRMLRRRGFEPELSFGAFDSGELIAFTFNGVGVHNGIMTAYDTGTGTVKEYRGQGLAQEIFRYALPFLKDAGVKQYLLEVLTDNAGAISVYQKLGFSVTRRFCCFRQQKSAVSFSGCRERAADIRIRKATVNDIAGAASFMDFSPSWQNSLESIRRAGEDLLYYAALAGEKVVGYCVTDPQTGDLTQIAVAPDYRRRGIASMLADEAIGGMETESVKVLNVCTTDDTLPFFLASGNILPASEQYEMVNNFSKVL